MKHILITSEKVRYTISEKEKAHIYGLMKAGETYAIIQGDIVPLNIKPSIISFEKWIESESQRLAVANKSLCKRCAKVIELGERCGCIDMIPKLPPKSDGPPVTSEFLKKCKQEILQKFSWTKSPENSRFEGEKQT